MDMITVRAWVICYEYGRYEKIWNPEDGWKDGLLLPPMIELTLDTDDLRKAVGSDEPDDVYAVLEGIIGGGVINVTLARLGGGDGHRHGNVMANCKDTTD